MSQEERRTPLKPVVILVGPTAVGKTEVAIGLAKELAGEIVTADSMQVYKGMDIGTAKPTLAEQNGVPHHLIDIVSPDESFNVARYREMAHAVIADIHARERLPIVSGGTGLYVRAVLDEFALPGSGSDPNVRARLTAEAEQHGKQALYERLVEMDPETAERLHPNDVRRVIRALEVYETTGKTMSQHLKEAQQKTPRYHAIRIGLTRPRAELYRRINQRVEQQVADGLVDEVRGLMQRYHLNKTARQALGYKEIIDYLEGKSTFEEAIERLKRETRRYAKRQYTWFRRDEQLRWFDLHAYASQCEAIDDIATYIRQQLSAKP